MIRLVDPAFLWILWHVPSGSLQTVVIAGGAIVLLAGLIGVIVRWPSLLLWPFRRRVRNVLAWMFVVPFAGVALVYAWYVDSHITCDFANQWLMGRMLYCREGTNLYVVGREERVLATGYQGDDLENMTLQILHKARYNRPEDIEGPLYPPTMALLMYPFAVMEPKGSQAALVLTYVLLGFFAAWMISRGTQGRIQMSEAALVIFLFPNIGSCLLLSQNSLLSLAIVTGGWFWWARGRPWLAGLTWGLLAFKPVFAVALIWVPVMLLNWRMLLGMIAGGAAFCTATLPWCGVESWRRWFIVGRNAAEIYAVDGNWVWMSRDLVGLPRRMMWDWHHFTEHVKYVLRLRPFDGDVLQGVYTEPEWVKLLVTGIGMSLVAVVIGVTILVVIRDYRRRWRAGLPITMSPWGKRIALLLLGALLTSYHFMHYDLLLMALPMLLLLADLPRLSWRFRIGLILLAGGLLYCTFDLVFGQDSVRIPFETLLLLAAWAGLAVSVWKSRLIPDDDVAAGSRRGLAWLVDGDGDGQPDHSAVLGTATSAARQ